MAENNKLFIVDASVILKWYFREEDDVPQAVRLRDDYTSDIVNLEMPHYTLGEVLNTMGRRLPKDDALSFFSWLLDFNMIQHHLTIELASVAIELMKKFPGVTFYDTGYHALALQQGGIFITADEKYYAKTRKQGSIILLKDYGKKG